MGRLGPRMSHIASQLWISCKDCLTILHNERGKRDMEIILMVFRKKSFSEKCGHFGTKMVWCPLHFESALRLFNSFYSIEGTKRYIKILLVAF